MSDLPSVDGTESALWYSQYARSIWWPPLCGKCHRHKAAYIQKRTYVCEGCWTGKRL